MRQIFKCRFFLIVSLIFDLLHCVIPAIIWDYFHKKKEREGVGEEEKIDHPAWMPKPAYFFLWLKILTVVIAYGFIFKGIFGRIT